MQFFRLLIYCFMLLFLCLPFSAGQDIPSAEEVETEFEPLDSFKITVNVSEVRLDVVVVDGRGRPITDLTAEDFEVYQDRLPQRVTSGIYISDQMEAAARPAASPQKNSPNIPPAALKKEEVRRTILFVVDNLSMSQDDMYFTKAALRRFVEKQMQPGDLVAIMRTGYGNSVLDMFVSDKRQLLARIDALYEEVAMPDRIYGSQTSTISYGIRAMKEMPGRKSLFLFTSEYTVNVPRPRILDSPDPINYYELYASAYRSIGAPEPVAGSIPEIASLNMPTSASIDAPASINVKELYDNAYSRLADEALRAGVVIHLLVPHGLEYYPPSIPDGGVPEGWADSLSTDFPVSNRAERAQDENYSFINPLPAKTGGLIVRDSNFHLDGIGQDANNMIAGYYLISYTPPSDTFDRTVYHRVNVRVKRGGAVVHTREGFYSRLESETDSGAASENPLQDAVFSPFQHPDLNVNIAAGYIQDAKAGYIIHSWIHLDTKDVKMVETEEGGRIELETVCLTSGINNVSVQDVRNIKYTFDIKPENIAWIHEHGLRFSLLLPVKKPGAYNVRVAIRDMETDRIGTAYQFVEIPDLRKKGLALSDIFMITSVYDLGWMHSDVINEIKEGHFFPVMRKEETGSPALKTYMPGDSLQTMTMVYNADAKAIERSEIKTQSILYRDGVEILRSEPRPIDSNSVEKSGRVPILQKLSMGTDMQPGRYTLQLLATDKKARENLSKREGEFSKILRAYLSENPAEEKKGVAVQTLSLTVTEKPSGR